MNNTYTEILRALGRIEGQLVEIQKLSEEIRRLSERVNKLEIWQAWLKGGWALLVAAYLYISRQALKLSNIP